MTQTYSSRHGAGRHNVQELMLMLDEHLAWSVEAEERNPALNRRGSAGTLIVDWDGTGEPQISYRGQRQSPSSQAGNIVRTVHADEQAKPTDHLEARHYQKPTRASRAKPRRSSHSLNELNAPEGPSPPLSKRSAFRPPKAQSHGNYDSTRPHLSAIQQTPAKRLSSTNTHCRSGNARYGRVPSNHKSFQTSAYNSTNRTIYNQHPRPRRDSTAVQYHHDHEFDQLQVRYNPSTNRVHGHDPKTGYAYDYNGRVVHVHQSPTSSVASRTSEYYAADVRDYKPDASVKVVDKPLPLTPREAQKREKTVGFVKKLLHKLDRMGIVGRMRQEREKQRRSREWVGQGYIA